MGHAMSRRTLLQTCSYDATARTGKPMIGWPMPCTTSGNPKPYQEPASTTAARAAPGMPPGQACRLPGPCAPGAQQLCLRGWRWKPIPCTHTGQLALHHTAAGSAPCTPPPRRAWRDPGPLRSSPHAPRPRRPAPQRRLPGFRAAQPGPAQSLQLPGRLRPRAAPAAVRLARAHALRLWVPQQQAVPVAAADA